MRALVGSLLVVLAIAAPLASAGPMKSFPAHVSWADKQHRDGWALQPVRTKGGWCPSRYVAARVCATEDGGRHWHGILYGNFDHALAIVRSTPSAGIVDLVHGNEPYPLLTLDNGRHWYLNSRMYGATRVWVTKRRVYWDQYKNVYRLSGWPGAAVRVTCSVPGVTTVWVYGVHAVGPRRNVCWVPMYHQIAGIVRGVSKTLVRGPDQSLVSWADSRHAFATDPAGARWRCAPPGARGYVVTLCGTDDGGKNWWISYSQEWRAKTLDSLVTITSVWRGPAKHGAFVLDGEADGASGETVFVSHDGGGNWDPSDAFYAGIRHDCGYTEAPPGTECASGVRFHDVHATPLELVYDLSVCLAASTAPCEQRTYRMDGWPNGTLTPVQLSP